MRKDCTTSMRRFLCGNERRPGFTLVELILVMAIISLMILILAPTVPQVLTQYRVNVSKTLLATLSTGVESYKHVYGEYPPGCLRNPPGLLYMNNNIALVGDYTDSQGYHSLYVAMQGPGGMGWGPHLDEVYPGEDLSGLLEFGPYPPSPSNVGTDRYGHEMFEDAFDNPVCYWQANMSSFAEFHYPCGPGTDAAYGHGRYTYNVNHHAALGQKGADEPLDWHYKSRVFEWWDPDAVKHWALKLRKGGADAAGRWYPHNSSSYLLWMAGGDQLFGYWEWSEEHDGYVVDQDPTDPNDGWQGTNDDITNF